MKATKAVLKLLKKEAPLTASEVVAKLADKQLKAENIVKALALLEEEGQISHDPVKGYAVISPEQALIGQFIANPKGFGFVSLPTGDVFVARRFIGGAMHQDTVKVSLKKRKGALEAEVKQVLKRAHTTVIGRFEQHRRFAVVVPVEKRLIYDFIVPPDFYGEAKTGDIVQIEITRYPTDEQMPEGKVVKVIGAETAHGIDISTIVLAHNWPTTFSETALNQAEAAVALTQVGLDKRRDLRQMFTVTIDGLDAKDFDDAISVSIDERGYFNLAVHIADVSHFIPLNSVLDKEAKERATSVYLPDRVLPMLPPRLSNDICSLKPLVDRLTFSVLMEVNPDGEVENFWLGETVINSNARLTYEEVDLHLKEGFFKEPELEQLILAAFLLSQVLEKKRLARGSLNFEIVEPKIVLDAEGEPVAIKIREKRPATQLIEEIMILTNEVVAGYMLKQDAPMLYRVHDRPDPDAVYTMGKLIKKLGFTKGLEGAHPRTFQALIDFVHNRPEKILVNSLLLRAMSQAKYAPVLIPHFGLAAEHYCHFTSPIRRYPDLIVHRLLKAVLKGELEKAETQLLISQLDELAEHCSRQEREAEALEREAVEVKMAKYMLRHVGDEFLGVISGVTSFGFFVELDNTAEGLVPIRELKDDYYRYDPEAYLLRGERKGKTYQLGQQVKVKLVNVSVANRQLDFTLVSR